MAGRGRLNSLDLLPPEAQDDIVWACQEFAARQKTIADIHFEFNDRLEAKGIEGVSRSSFYRAAADKAAAALRMQNAREMFKGISSQFEAKDVDENTVVLGEFIKTLIVELVSDGGGAKSPKEAMELARAYHATVAAQKISADRRRQVEADMRNRITKAVDAVEGEVKKAGDVPNAAAVLKKIREEVYGIFDK